MSHEGKKMHPPLIIPTVDLSPFFNAGDDSGKKKAKDIITQACMEFGFFQIENHGVPSDLMDRALDLSKTFFSYPDEVKREASSEPRAPLPVGYFKPLDYSPDKNEYVLMYPPGSPFNVLPDNPPDFGKTLEDIFNSFVKTALLLEEILNECLGLPSNFLKEYNNDRGWDFMVSNMYPPATEHENIGISGHEDGSLITIVLQGDVGGLEVYKDGEWIPVIPSKDKLVVNISDLIHVLSNKIFKSATHRVSRPKGGSRLSIAFFLNVHGDKWVEPLPKFTEEIGIKPKYKGFYYKDYIALRSRNEYQPPTKPEDFTRITHYEI